MRSRAWMWATALAVAGALGAAGTARAATITVTTHADPADASCAAGSGSCSLREAASIASDGASKIVFGEPGTYDVTQGMPIVIPFDVTIDGGGAGGPVTIDGRRNTSPDGTNRIFILNSGVTATIRNLTLTGAHDVVEQSGGSTRNEAGGGALFVPAGATADVDHVEFAGNFAFVGGAVSSAGRLTVADSWFHDDNGALGAGIAVKGGTASVDRTTFADERGQAGAVYVYGGAQVTITNSSVSGSGQSNSRGGGIDNDSGTVTLRNDTLAGNLRGSLETNAGATTSVQDTIVADGFSDGDTDCVAAGLPATDDRTTAKAITNDLGHNLDQDGSCGLSSLNGGRSHADPSLAPPADNGGFAPTPALLHDSAAIDNGAECPVVDERNDPRPFGSACDIGAFEAVRTGKAPSVATQDATAIGAHSAQLNASVDLEGEAGGAHFEWGATGDQVATGHGAVTAVAAAGRSATASFTLDGLQPARTYFYRAIADNATAASAPGDVRSFTTAPGPPDVADLAVDTVTDTTAEVSFTIDPNGADTTYVVKWGTDALTQSTQPAGIDAQPGPRTLRVPLGELRPDTTYSVEVVATSSEAPDGVTADTGFATERQLTAHPGGLVTLEDSGDGCPTATIDWGDDSPAEAGSVDCQDGGEFGQTFFLSAGHEYAQPGHYPIAVDYGRDGSLHEWALIEGSEQHVLRVKVSGPGEVSGTGIDCPSLCATSADAGSPVDLTASSNPTAVFLGWSGDCTGTDPEACSVTLDGDRQVTARFAAPPALSAGRGADPATDTTAQLHFTLDPSGADTTYRVEYGTDAGYGQTFGPVSVPAGEGVQDLSPTLTGLRPDTTYHFHIVATNDQGSADSGDDTFTTEPQVAAVAGQAVTIRDRGLFEGPCPTATVDWGDGTPATDADVACDPATHTATLTASHTYAAAGHYPISIGYDTGGATEQWALISAPQQATPTPTPTATAPPTPTPTPTATPTPPPAPVFHQQVVVRPVSGTVLVRRKGSHTFVPLDTKAGVPLGSQVDVTHGRIQLTSVPRRGGKPQSAQFYAGIFTVTQPGSITQLTLSGPKPTCPPARGAASAAAKRKTVKSRKLWGNGHGSFRTSGQYSAATVRGTQWLVQDTCAGTLTRVAHGLVAVTDRVRHKTILVRGGKSYLARPRKR